MSRLAIFASGFVDRWANLDPTDGALSGIASTPPRLSDWSPEGRRAIEGALRAELEDLARLGPLDAADERRRAAMADQLRAWVDSLAARDYTVVCEPGFLAPPLLNRLAIESQPVADADAVAARILRLRAVPESASGYRRSLEAGLSGMSGGAARPLAERLAHNLRLGHFEHRRFTAVASRAAEAGAGSGAVAEAYAAAEAADNAYVDLARWLRSDYAPRTTTKTAVGPERYARHLRDYLGESADPQELAAWGWEEVNRLDAEPAATLERGWPGVGRAQVLAMLDDDPAQPSAANPNAFLAWITAVSARTRPLVEAKFEMPATLGDPVHRLAPPGSGFGGFYSPPNDDGHRPGTVTWNVPEGRIPLWRYQAVIHHEGLPGHHLEMGGARFLAPSLNRFQSVLGKVEGHHEGWGLYAERVMDEVGAFEHPADRVGFLAAQLFRAVRVVVDTGLHLGLRVPAGEPVHGGEAIDESVASDLLMQRGLLETREAARSEVLRYLGAPGQALAYKVGERAWLQARVAVRAAAPGLSDRAFHTAALALGPVPLHLLSDQAVAAVTEAEPHGSG